MSFLNLPAPAIHALVELKSPGLLVIRKYLAHQVAHRVGCSHEKVHSALHRLEDAELVEPVRSQSTDQVIGYRLTPKGASVRKRSTATQTVLDCNVRERHNQAKSKVGNQGGGTPTVPPITDQPFTGRASTMTVCGMESRVFDAIDLVLLGHLSSVPTAGIADLKKKLRQTEWPDAGRRLVYRRIQRFIKAGFVKTAPPSDNRRLDYAVTEQGRVALRNSQDFYRSVLGQTDQ